MRRWGGAPPILVRIVRRRSTLVRARLSGSPPGTTLPTGLLRHISPVAVLVVVLTGMAVARPATAGAASPRPRPGPRPSRPEHPKAPYRGSPFRPPAGPFAAMSGSPPGGPRPGPPEHCPTTVSPSHSRLRRWPTSTASPRWWWGTAAASSTRYHLGSTSPSGTSVAGWPTTNESGPIDSTRRPCRPVGFGLSSVLVGSGNDADPTTGGYQAFGPSGGQLWFTRRWSTRRPTRARPSASRPG